MYLQMPLEPADDASALMRLSRSIQSLTRLYFGLLNTIGIGAHDRLHLAHDVLETLEATSMEELRAAHALEWDPWHSCCPERGAITSLSDVRFVRTELVWRESIVADFD